ncbi:hypothetical protein A2368_00035 [Candidatus Collierbacteria bacterium RIFOXYB1_FULL_49_13]|uniref:Pyrrolo-quinoline quinone repeat domain-containing protein n=1 Tax=Candidatus Collierbacteria bacterium RIFOXYB1_FULL_49_13 TaxID=1817728 RepID=A0A1F5FFT8_9BACT|nr:MAG: hypothetical protein A2368_00035 [Candidatus Collierbacteria bacterium RIFOXYB1_FULL_49_13]
MAKFALVLFAFFLLFSGSAYAENLSPAGVIPKLPKTANDPILINGKVHPFWGPICQRYTYSVVYSDKAGRPPQYVKIYFNGKLLDMQKEDNEDDDYQKGVKYIFKNVPKKYGSNFYYFEASNGLGKARASIIDSPDNGPVLFDSDFNDNEIVLIDPLAGKELWRYPTGPEWVGAVALSDDGRYLAAQSSSHVYFFDSSTNEPLWIYESPTKSNIGGDVKGGVAISADGAKVFAALNGKALFFDRKSNKPVWTYNLEQNGGGAYGVDISKDGSHTAVAMAGSESDENSNVLLLFNQKGKKLWQYHSSGNWHEVSFSTDGLYLSAATGCPDRRGYLFSVDSSEPIIKSEPLSGESPIDEAKISADGDLVAYGVESDYGAIVLMSKNSKQIIWKYETPSNKSVRALTMTPDGKFIGAGTFGGDILLFETKSSNPVERFKINSSIGAFDLSDDGSVFMTGSADKKVRIYKRGETKAKAEIKLNEYVGELDISANGKFAAAGTSGAVYFFESLIDLNSAKVSSCNQIIEPPKEETTFFGGQNNTNSPPIQSDEKTGVPVVSLTLSIIAMVVFVLVSRGREVKGKRIILVSLGLVTILALLTTAFFFWKDEDPQSGKNICGDSICNSSFGETKNNCPQDCME